MPMMLSEEGVFQREIETGLRLSELPESEGGWREYFEEDAGLAITDPILRAHTALMLENTKLWLASQPGASRRNAEGRIVLNENTISAMVGGFSDYLFPIIRAAFPSNPLNDLVSVQPTTKPHATIMFWNWIFGTTKGSYTQGQRITDANTGRDDSGFNYSNEVIDREVIGTGTGSSAVGGGTLKFHDGGGVRPGTVVVSATVSGSVETVYDNAQGGFANGVTGTINYVTGAVSVTFSGNIDSGTDVVARYRWNSEGSDSLPEVDVQITTSTTATERRALRLRYSLESAQDVNAELGINLEPQLVTGCAEQLNFETARQVIHEIWINTTVSTTFAKSPPSTEYNQQDHFRDLVYHLQLASDSITNATQKAYGNWIIADSAAATVIQSLPKSMFEAAPRPANMQGVHFVGTLNGQFRVYKDIFLNREPGASAYGNLLMGYKGNQFFEAGMVWSPYRLFYTTDSITLSNMVTQKGMASRYATKMVNPRMYTRINLGA